MSGTFPPMMEEAVINQGMSNVKIHRSITNRNEIHYIRCSIDSGDEGNKSLISKAVDIINEVTSKLGRGSRIIVTCSCYVDVDEMYTALEERNFNSNTILKYYGCMEESDKAKCYQDWLKIEESVVMVATTAFGLGDIYIFTHITLYIFTHI